ncbi:MAG TPA: hypothetical protein VGI97_14775 [Gemmatimonadaceae bacterium]|jgi:hypothetical protein
MPDTLASAGANTSHADGANNSAAVANNATGAGAGNNTGGNATGENNTAGNNAVGGGADGNRATGNNAADGAGGNNAGANTAGHNQASSYDLKLPDGSKHDAAFVERTAAIARELGLDQKGAEKLLTERVKEADAAAQARETAVAAMKPGGEIWERRDQEYRTNALKDKELGHGDPAKLDVAIEKVQQALKAFGDPELLSDLKESGWGSKPSVLRLLARIGRSMGEGTQIVGAGGATPRKKSDAEVMFPNMYNDDGTPKTT